MVRLQQLSSHKGGYQKIAHYAHPKILLFIPSSRNGDIITFGEER